jgi:hypothetical protein
LIASQGQHFAYDSADTTAETACSTIMILMLALCVKAGALEKAAMIDNDQVPSHNRQFQFWS